MSGSLLAQRYAKALFELAHEQQAEELVRADMEKISRMLKESRELRLFLRSPVIFPGKKEKIIRDLLETRSHPLTLAFMLMLVRKRRELHIPDIAFEYQEFYDDHFNIITVRLKSAVRVSPAIRDEVFRIMKQYTQATVKIEEEIDESLIGGFSLSWKDNLYDVSIRKQLNQLNRGVARINLYKKEM